MPAPGFGGGAPRSRRTLVLSTSVLRKLRDHRGLQDQERELAGDRWVETGLVFTTPFGTALDGPNVTRSFQRLLKRSGLERQRFHDLRHSRATLLLAQDVGPRVVMEILGHSQTSLTTTPTRTWWVAYSARRRVA